MINEFNYIRNLYLNKIIYKNNKLIDNLESYKAFNTYKNHIGGDDVNELIKEAETPLTSSDIFIPTFNSPKILKEENRNLLDLNNNFINLIEKIKKIDI